MNEDYKMGENAGYDVAKWHIAQEMRVLFCALITAHKRDDNSAFFATVDIAKTTLAKYVRFNDEDWALFRGDHPRPLPKDVIGREKK